MHSAFWEDSFVRVGDGALERTNVPSVVMSCTSVAGGTNIVSPTSLAGSSSSRWPYIVSASLELVPWHGTLLRCRRPQGLL